MDLFKTNKPVTITTPYSPKLILKRSNLYDLKSTMTTDTRDVENKFRLMSLPQRNVLLEFRAEYMPVLGNYGTKRVDGYMYDLWRKLKNHTLTVLGIKKR